MQAWNRLKTFLGDRGYDIRYFSVKEFTRRGKRHLHIVMNRHIPHSLLKYGWSAATDRHSFIVHITRTDFTVNSPGGYMTKYLTKTLHSKQFAKGEHRYSHDRKTDWSPVAKWRPPAGTEWTFQYHPSPITCSPGFTKRLNARIETGADPPCQEVTG